MRAFSLALGRGNCYHLSYTRLVRQRVEGLGLGLGLGLGRLGLLQGWLRLWPTQLLAALGRSRSFSTHPGPSYLSMRRATARRQR